MAYYAFYCCYSTGMDVDASDAHEIELDWAHELVLDILRDENDFFGLIDECGTTLQFMRMEDAVLMEIPVPTKSGSFSKSISIQEVVSIIKSLPLRIDSTSFTNFTFKSW